MRNPVGSLFIVLAIAWVLQLGLSLLQTRRFHRRVAELRRGGNTTSVGMAGSNWKRKVYGVLVVDEERNIVHAEKMSGFTVFANLKPVDAMSGMTLDRLDGEAPVGISTKMWKAFQNAAGFIRNRDKRDEDESEDE